MLPAQRDLRMTEREIARFWKFVVVDDVSDCWVWTGGTVGLGYGHFWLRGKTEKAHRVAFETWRGPIPWPLDLDHIVCSFPRCVNPWHTRTCTRAENNARSGCVSALGARMARCSRGHQFDVLLGARRKRGCSICINEGQRRRYHLRTPEQRARVIEVQRQRRALRQGGRGP